MSAVAGLLLDPLDVLFFRGSRALGPQSPAEGSPPFPQTLAGALRTAMVKAAGADLSRLSRLRRESPGVPVKDLLARCGVPATVLTARVRGPWFCRKAGDGIELLLPAPRALRTDGERLLRVAVVDETSRAWAFLHRSVPLPEGLRRPLWAASPRDLTPVTGYVTLDGLREFLQGGVPRRGSLVEPGALFRFDRRIGIGMTSGRNTVEEGLLYATTKLCLAPGVKLYVELEGDPSCASLLDGGVVKLGGEGHGVRVERVERPRGGLEGWSVASAGPRRMLVTVSPWAFGPGGLPSTLGTSLLAATVGKAQGHSGFDVALGGPRRNRWFAPAGSVFWIEGALPEGVSLASTEEERAVGEGLFVTGAWS
ncbi:MAG: type III-B CRISPR module-associated protein Cmr3 [Deltaproteobacteria bacterium]|nr:type III-B CRISPR module-associated protein Cmr3 [Deltaproteobacteria bacterium]